jgi:hypothetical protein
MTEMHKIYKTTDLSLAVYLAWCGCREAVPPWGVVTRPDGKKAMEFAFQNVDSSMISNYRNDVDGFRKYNGLRRFFLSIVKSEMAGDENDQ